MNFFIDDCDERNNFLITLLKNKKYCVFTLKDIKNAEPGDYFIFSPAKKITQNDLINLPNNSIIFCGNISNEVRENLKNKEFIYKNYMEDEIFAIKNANLTAEAVLSIIISSSKKSIYKNNILIFGAGRISKALAILFNKLGLSFSICNYHKKNYENAYIFTDNCLFADEYKNCANSFDIVVNTIPYNHLTTEDCLLFNNGTIYIETASNMGIVEDIKNFIIIKAPALPKKYSPESAAEIMKDFIIRSKKWKLV